MTTQSQDLSLQVERILKTSPERTFRAWVEPDEMQHWFAPSEEMDIEAEVDLKVGGRYRVAMGSYVVEGEYQEIERPRRLVFTWQWTNEPASNEMLVTVEFFEHHSGTRLVLTHERLVNEEAREQHASGWEALLARLERLAESAAV